MESDQLITQDPALAGHPAGVSASPSQGIWDGGGTAPRPAPVSGIPEGGARLAAHGAGHRVGLPAASAGHSTSE